MFKLIIAASFVLLLLQEGCEDNGAIAKKISTGTIEKKIVQRDLSVNKDNAYNDIFLDSGDVEKFIKDQKLNDTISSAMRDFLQYPQL